MAGLIKGFGKGIGGVVLKPGAGRLYAANFRFYRLTVKPSGEYRATLSRESTKRYKSILVRAYRTTSSRLVRRKDTMNGCPQVEKSALTSLVVGMRLNLN